jgi:hypothetical protein
MLLLVLHKDALFHLHMLHSTFTLYTLISIPKRETQSIFFCLKFFFWSHSFNSFKVIRIVARRNGFQRHFSSYISFTSMSHYPEVKYLSLGYVRWTGNNGLFFSLSWYSRSLQSFKIHKSNLRVEILVWRVSSMSVILGS